MSEKSKIEWTDATWNPLAGCTKCSPGCENCYAERMSHRLESMQHQKDRKKYKHLWKYNEVITCGAWNNSIYLDIPSLDKPLHWHKPRRIFVCSMSDLFHPKVPFDFIDKVMFTIYKSYSMGHTFQILTKRVRRMMKYFSGNVDGRIIGLFRRTDNRYTSEHRLTNSVNLLPRVRLGVSISNQAEADEKIPIIIQIPAAFRWLSIEPLLSKINLTAWLDVQEQEFTAKRNSKEIRSGSKSNIKNTSRQKLDLVVVGCESGPKRRPCKIEWVESIVAQCKAAYVPVFVKQINVNGKVVKMPKLFPQQSERR